MINIHKTAKELQDEWKLSDYQALDIATKIAYNKIMETGLAATDAANTPTGIEFIGMALDKLAKK